MPLIIKVSVVVVIVVCFYGDGVIFESSTIEDKALTPPPDHEEIRVQENKQPLFENDAGKMCPNSKTWFQLRKGGGKTYQ